MASMVQPLLRYQIRTTSISRLRAFLLLSVILPASFRAFAQAPDLKEMRLVDSIHRNSFHSTLEKKHFTRAAGELLLGELVPWVVDKYVRDISWAQISFHSAASNLKPSSWSWDNDPFATNQIGHPFHGSIFFNAFRSNGYSFWQSAPAPFAGSYLWETFAENLPPSINDFINTGFGGVMLGEVTHRMANKLINKRSRGFKRQAGEVFALLINPSNGLTRLMNGQWGKVPDNHALFDTTKVSAELDIGARKYNVNNKNPFQDGHFGIYGRLRLLYGSPSENMKDPFSNIKVTIEAGKDDSAKLNMVSVYGSLAGWKIYTQHNTYLAVLSANYDYIKNEAFYYSAEGVRMNFYSDFRITDKLKLNAAAGAGIIILAAIPNSYIFDGRNYDYGPGVSYYGTVKFNAWNRLAYVVTYRGGRIGTVNGNGSNYLLHAFTNELSVAIVDGFSLSAEEGYFNLHGNYRHFPDVNKTYPYARLSIRYNFDP